MASSIPPLTITSTGVTVPTSTAVLDASLADINAAFGGQLDVSVLGTPQGQIASTTTTAVQAANAAVAYMVSQVDPATAEGRMQDAIGRIYDLTRIPASASVVDVDLICSPGLTIPAGQAQMQDTSGRRWVSTNAVTFSGSGLATTEFHCLELGPVTLGVGQLNRIAVTYSGFDAGSNPGSATVGRSVESRYEFELRRQQSVANHAHGTVSALFASVAAVPGVLDVFTLDNGSGSPLVYGASSYTLAAHSVYVAVVGGADAEVAQAIWLKKDMGCALNGSTTYDVSDTASYVYPYPTYTMRWVRPASYAIKYAVSIAANPLLPSDIVVQTKAAIIAAFNGEDGGSRARIGGTLYASRYYGPIVAISPAVAILSLKLGHATATLDVITAGIDQSPTLDAADITVTIV